MPANVGDKGSIPGSERSPGEANGKPLQYSCLENPMDRGALRAVVHGVSKSLTWLSNQMTTKSSDLNICHVSIGHLCVFFRKISSPALFKLHCLSFSFDIDLKEFFSKFWILISYQMYHLQVSFLIQEVAFSFCWQFPSLCRSCLV